MIHYDYRAYGPDGTVHAGAIDAASKIEACRLLQKQGLRLFDISECGKRNWMALLHWEGIRRKNHIDTSVLFGDLQVMLEAGFTIDQALQAAGAGMAEGQGRKWILSVTERLKSGESLSTALTAIPHIPVSIIAVIVSGEASGQLSQVISLLAARLQAQEKRRTAIRDALIYPIFLLAVMVLAMSVITFILVPALAPVFEGSGKPPPILVSALSSFHSFLTGYGWAFVFLLVLIVLATLTLIRTGQGRLLLSRLVIGQPVLGSVIKNYANERYLSTLALLLGHGVPMVKALELSADTNFISHFGPDLQALRDQVASGRRLRDAMKESGVFDQLTLAMISIGDDANRLPESLNRAATMLGAQAQKTTERFIAMLTPTFTLAVGGLIGTLVLSVMDALLSINAMALP